MKAEDPMAMMREAHRELSASYQQVAANKKPSARLCRWFCMKFVRLEVRIWKKVSTKKTPRRLLIWRKA